MKNDVLPIFLGCMIFAFAAKGEENFEAPDYEVGRGSSSASDLQANGSVKVIDAKVEAFSRRELLEITPEPRAAIAVYPVGTKLNQFGIISKLIDTSAQPTIKVGEADFLFIKITPATEGRMVFQSMTGRPCGLLKSRASFIVVVGRTELWSQEIPDMANHSCPSIKEHIPILFRSHAATTTDI